MLPSPRRSESARHQFAEEAAARVTYADTTAAPEGAETPGASAVADDRWAGGIDLLILRVADWLRRAGAEMPERQLRRVAEAIVQDAAGFALEWAEAPVDTRLARFDVRPEAGG